MLDNKTRGKKAYASPLTNVFALAQCDLITTSGDNYDVLQVGDKQDGWTFKEAGA